MLHPPFPIRAEVVKPQAVFLGINLINEALPKDFPSSRIYKALENRKLNTLAIILACLGNSSQSPPPGFVLGSYVITDQNKHDIPYLQKKGG
jgi:hypothetical protein